MSNVTNPLVDQRIISASQAALTAAASRLATAQAGIGPAKELADKAKERAELAIASGDANAMDLSEKADVMGRRLAVSKRIAEVAADALALARDDLKVQTGIAYRGVYANGVQARLDAARAADIAREALKAAEAKYDAATASILFAIQNGAQDVVYGNWQHHTLVDAATEAKRWSANFHHAWWAGLDSDGNVAFSG
jgi:hypothetical protein